jgi:hypothetical protein
MTDTITATLADTLDQPAKLCGFRQGCSTQQSKVLLECMMESEPGATRSSGRDLHLLAPKVHQAQVQVIEFS